ncbi:MAG TPA: hypothetical protein VGK30_16205 [Candidatus Binatia bacterium]
MDDAGCVQEGPSWVPFEFAQLLTRRSTVVTVLNLSVPEKKMWRAKAATEGAAVDACTANETCRYSAQPPREAIDASDLDQIARSAERIVRVLQSITDAF